MKPSVDIKKVRAYFYNYTIRTKFGMACYARSGLRSVAECLHDAATALGANFRAAQIRYDGIVLGHWSIPTLEHDPVALANLLIARLVELHQWHPDELEDPWHGRVLFDPTEPPASVAERRREGDARGGLGCDEAGQR